MIILYRPSIGTFHGEIIFRNNETILQSLTQIIVINYGTTEDMEKKELN